MASWNASRAGAFLFEPEKDRVESSLIYEKLIGFDWDDANEDHILRHGVVPNEVEEAASQKNVIYRAQTASRERRTHAPRID